MTDSESDDHGDSHDEIADCKHCESIELETLAKGDEWGEEAFRDAGDATFGSG